ncbi:MAG: hypothetical protein JW780_05740 [Clostridiales bacterium]|nr:hypothetical protein [Clostridiales bacterium]
MILFRELFSEPRTLWLLLASALIPAAVLLFFYNQNSIYVSFRPVLITAAFCALTTVLFWLFALWIIRNAFSVSLLCLILWFGIFFESLLHQEIITIFGRIFFFYILWILLSIALSYVLRNIKAKSAFSFIFCAFISVFFIISLVTSAVTSVSTLYARDATIKTDFVVDVNEDDRPNIYWIHCDGMLSFETIEKYFGDHQDEFRDALNERGFLINETASVYACYQTTIAVPALMSPSFYDAYLSDYLRDRTTACERAISDPAQALLKDVRLQNETIGAFEAAGYTTNTVALMDQYFFPTTDRFYFPVDPNNNINFVFSIYNNSPFDFAQTSQLSKTQAEKMIAAAETDAFLRAFFRPGFELNAIGSFSENSVHTEPLDHILSDETLQGIFLDAEPARLQHSYFVNALAYILEETPETQPQFSVLMDLMFHYPYVFDENGNRPSTISVHDSRNYHGQHVFFSKVLINIIDMILDSDPDAVIVLQSDHGMNTHLDSELIDHFRQDPQPVCELRNSTMSAIRVPEKYRNGEEKYAMSNPLNISRYLVNNYVGENYEYRTEDT